MSEPPVRIVGDVRDLPASATGPTNLVWWGNFGFMLIEGMAFLLAAGCYLYLMARTETWPPSGDAPPGLFWSGAFTLALLLSMFPNLLLLRAARNKQARRVRWLAALMMAYGVALIVLRAFEFAHLGIDWQKDAYGSVTWMLLVLHSTHLVTELGETGVQTAWLFTHEIGDDQFADMEDDANYWTFVAIAWLPLYALIYWAPRLA
ncbi:heme/copper-type cytochrome/quinol oxidase subunit 3 [Sphingomonas zeicaulis]|uniref:cytochrome c oxidase subunit 3 n=1 Tax=Sphingomonas zeicaulis TaxID=1632740 RepID=UPI003D1D03F5